MFKLLGKLLGRDFTSATPEVEITETLSDAEIMRELNPHLARKTDLRRFMQFMSAHLPSVEAKRLTRLVVAALPEADSPCHAIELAIFGDDGQQLEHMLFAYVDWKAPEEIAWQVNGLLLTRQVNEIWQATASATVPDELTALATWLAARELSLLQIDTENDAYCFAILPQQDFPKACQLATSAGLTILAGSA